MNHNYSPAEQKSISLRQDRQDGRGRFDSHCSPPISL